MGLSFLLSCERRSWLCAGIVFIMQQAPARCTSPRRYLPSSEPSLLPSSALLRQPSLFLINPMVCRAHPPTPPLSSIKGTLPG